MPAGTVALCGNDGSGLTGSADAGALGLTRAPLRYPVGVTDLDDF